MYSYGPTGPYLCYQAAFLDGLGDEALSQAHALAEPFPLAVYSSFKLPVDIFPRSMPVPIAEAMYAHHHFGSNLINLDQTCSLLVDSLHPSTISEQISQSHFFPWGTHSCPHFDPQLSTSIPYSDYQWRDAEVAHITLPQTLQHLVFCPTLAMQSYYTVEGDDDDDTVSFWSLSHHCSEEHLPVYYDAFIAPEYPPMAADI